MTDHPFQTIMTYIIMIIILLTLIIVIPYVFGAIGVLSNGGISAPLLSIGFITLVISAISIFLIYHYVLKL